MSQRGSLGRYSQNRDYFYSGHYAFFLGFESRWEGRSASCAAFEILPYARVAYLRITLDRIPLAGWIDLPDRLDKLFDVWFGTRRLFREWRCFSENLWTSAGEKRRTR